MNDLFDTLVNSREKVVDVLLQNYSYDFLLKIFTLKNNSNTDDKSLYKTLIGVFGNNKYNKSSINWIPSEELINGILALAYYYEINHIEEIYTDMGILSALLTKKNGKINITTADTFENINTCNKLGLVPIAKRSAGDYKYYHIFNEKLPQMIISTYYPDNNIKSKNSNMNAYIEEMSHLIKSKNHKIIMIFVPCTFIHFYELLHYIEIGQDYIVNTFNVKAFDKYFYVTNLVKKYYKSSMLVHILINKNLSSKNKISTNKLFRCATIPAAQINIYCKFLRWLKILYDKLSPKLIKSMYKDYDLTMPLSVNIKIKDMIQRVVFFSQVNLINIPQYIFDVDEFLFWANCVSKKMYFVFETRTEFYTFYTQANNPNFLDIDLPLWAKAPPSLYKYIYLCAINKINIFEGLREFNTTFDKINNHNKNFLCGKN